MRIDSTTLAATAGQTATATAAPPPAAGSHGPRRSGGPKLSGGPKVSGGPKRSGGPGNDRGLHLGQIKRAMKDQTAGGGSIDLEALGGLTSRLSDVIGRLNTLTSLVTEATAAAGATGTASGTSGSTAGGAGGAAGTGAGGGGGAGGTGSAGGTPNSTSVSTPSLAFPFQGYNDFGSVTINGVTTSFGIIDAASGLSANQVASSLVNILNSNPDNVITAQQRDNKILLVAKTMGTTISVDDIQLGTAPGAGTGFAGFLEGMTGSGTLLSNPISPVRS